MLMAPRLFVFAVLFLAGETTAFVPVSSKLAAPALVSQQRLVPLNNEVFEPIDFNNKPSTTTSWTTAAAAVPVLTTLFLSIPADAATGGAPIPSAVAAYVHYASILIMAACITIERVTVKAGMSQEDQDLISSADIALGISGVTLAVSGYYRAVEYGKGWDFYAHEPVFWLKIALVGVFGACSFFPTTKIIQRAVQKQQEGQYPEMSEKLAARMKSVLNAEILALLSIPLFATIMSRGIGYNDSIPWPAEAALSAVIFVGLGFKYIKEALDFEEDDEVLAVPPPME